MNKNQIIAILPTVIPALPPGVQLNPDDPIGKYVGNSQADVDAFIDQVNAKVFPMGGG